jgi:hypothetical protein
MLAHLPSAFADVVHERLGAVMVVAWMGVLFLAALAQNSRVSGQDIDAFVKVLPDPIRAALAFRGATFLVT